MAERNTAKSSATARAPAGTKAGGKAKRSATAKPGRKADIAMGLAEQNAKLTAELTTAHERIAELELKHSEIINRIDWVIDSLHNLTDER